MDKDKLFKKFLSLIRKFYIYLVLLAIYIPLIIIILISFNEPSGHGNINFNFGVPTFVNYLNLFSNDEFINALINSLLLMVVVVPISVIIATITCLGMWKSNQKIIQTVMFTSNVTIVNPEAITGVSLVVLFSATWIPMGLNLGFITVILAHISFCTPYAIVAIWPRMSKMNPNHILASYDLGHNAYGTFFRIMLPFLLPAILSGAAICAAMSFDDFIITNFVNGDFETIGTLIYSSRQGIKAWIIAFGSIIIVITIVIILIVCSIKFAKLKKQNKKNMFNPNAK